MSEAPTVGEPHATQDEVLGILCRWTKDDDYDLLTCIRDLRRALATLPVVPPKPVAWRWRYKGTSRWTFTPVPFIDSECDIEPLFTLPVGDVEPRSSLSHSTESDSAFPDAVDGDRA